MVYQIKDAKVDVDLTNNCIKADVQQMDFTELTKTISAIEQLEEKEVPLQEEISLDDAFTIIYTSGTTGFPKGVVHTYGNHWWSAISSALNLGIHAHDKWLAPLPFFHVGGLSVLMKIVIYGMPVYGLERFDDNAVHDAIMNKGVTMASVVTVMLQRLVALLDKERYPDTFRCMLLGGGPAPR